MGFFTENQLFSYPTLNHGILEIFSFLNILQKYNPIFDKINKIKYEILKITSQFLDLLVQGRFSLQFSPRCKTSALLLDELY